MVDSVVNLLQPRGMEIGEHVDEYFVGDPEYWEVVVRLNPHEHEGEGRYLDLSWVQI